MLNIMNIMNYTDQHVRKYAICECQSIYAELLFGICFGSQLYMRGICQVIWFQIVIVVLLCHTSVGCYCIVCIVIMRCSAKYVVIMVHRMHMHITILITAYSHQY